MSVIFWRTPNDPAGTERDDVDPPDYSTWDQGHLAAEASLMWRDRREASLDVMGLLAENEGLRIQNVRLRAQRDAARRAAVPPPAARPRLSRFYVAGAVLGVALYLLYRLAVWLALVIGTKGGLHG